MRVVRLYTPQTLAVGTELQLDDETRHYAVNVLRLNKTSSLTLFNGDGFDYGCEIISLSKKNIVVKTTERFTTHTESPLTTYLFLGISKSSHMDYAIQKTVEAGVSVIQPVSMQRTVSRGTNKSLTNKHQHWQHIIQSACEQSGRSKLPQLLTACTFEDITKISTEEHGLFFDVNAEHAMDKLRDCKPTTVKLLVGPEGGISKNENEALVSKGFLPVRCGPRILRTETAALAAVLQAQWLYGDLKP